MSNHITLADIESQVSQHQTAIRDLYQVGARIAADANMSGRDILGWLTARGATESEARALCVEILHERRAS